MYLQNLELEQINAEDLKTELLNEADLIEMPTEQDVKNTLAEMYQLASNATAPLYYKNAESFIMNKNESFSIQLAGENLWVKIKKFICNILNEGSTALDVIDAIIDFIVANIPGGVIIKHLVKRIVKYFLNKGYEALCKIEG